MLEVEVKVKIDDQNQSKTGNNDFKNIGEILLDLGFTKEESVFEKDTYFNGKTKDLRASDMALRIRENRNLDSGEVVFLLTFKGPKIDDSTMTRQETEFEIPSFEHGKMLLDGLDYFVAGEVEKTRISYIKDDITCCVDLVKNLGKFLEIEIMAEEEEYDLAISRIKELLGKLGLSLDDTIRNSYLSMLEGSVDD